MEIENDTKQQTATENVDLAKEKTPKLSPFEQSLLEAGILDNTEAKARFSPLGWLKYRMSNADEPEVVTTGQAAASMKALLESLR